MKSRTVRSSIAIGRSIFLLASEEDRRRSQENINDKRKVDSDSPHGSETLSFTLRGITNIVDQINRHYA